MKRHSTGTHVAVVAVVVAAAATGVHVQGNLLISELDVVANKVELVNVGAEVVDVSSH